MVNSTNAVDVFRCHHVQLYKTDNTFISMISDTVLCFLNFFLSFIATTSNALVIKVYMTSSLRRTTADILLVFVSIMEFLKAMFAQPSFILWRIMIMMDRNSCFAYIFAVAANNFCGTTSFFTTCGLITVERYLSVFRPILHRKPIVQRAFTIAIICTFSFTGLFLLAMFITGNDKAYFSVMGSLCFIYLAATAIVYFKIRAKIREGPPGHANNLRMANKQVADRRMNSTVLFIIYASIACYSPSFFVLVYFSVHERTKWRAQYILPYLYMTAFCTAALNPFIYCWKNRRLRGEMLKITKRFLKMKQRRFDSMHTSSSNHHLSTEKETNL